MVLNIYRREGINSYFTEKKVSYSSVLSVRAPVGVSGSEKRDRRRNRVDEHAGFMFLACLRWWTELALRMNRRGCRTACLHLELKDLKNIYFTSFLINMFIREVTVNIW